MAHFCQKTGARIAGPGLSDRAVLGPDDWWLREQNLARHPEAVELDGVELQIEDPNAVVELDGVAMTIKDVKARQARSKDGGA